MGKSLRGLFVIILLLVSFQMNAFAETEVKLRLGNDLLLEKHAHLIDGKNLGLITNQTGVNSEGKRTIDLLYEYPNAKLTALYSPEHGIDGIAKAGEYVESYMEPRLQIPVFSLYGKTRMPTPEMLEGIDVLLFDIQDIGARSYTYISTLNYCMIAAQKQGIPIVVLDRPNPLGGEIVDGPMLEEPYKSFVGVDLLPMAHGMTIGEVAQFFNRNIGAQLTVVPMEGYTRNLLFKDTGLPWVPTSPNIPDLSSVMGYMATGLGEGTGIVQRDKFKWIGGKGIDSQKYAQLLSQAALPGVRFIPEMQGELGGVRLDITDPYTFNPAKTGIYALAYAQQLNRFEVPVSGKTVVMFDKIMGTNKIGQYLKQGLSPEQIELNYAEDLKRFKEEREKYLIYEASPELEPVKKVVLEGGIVHNNKSFIPLRMVLTELGYTVSYEPADRKIYAEKPGKRIVLDTTVSPMPVWVNDVLMPPTIDPFTRNGVSYLPANFITWIEKSTQQTIAHTVVITKEGLEIQVKLPVPKPSPQPKPVPKQALPVAGKVAYLTLDDGPSTLTSQVLDILKEHQVKATFFVIGKNIKGNEQVLKRAVAEGHVIAGHTFSHDYNKIYRNVEAFFKDLEAGNKEIQRATGVKPTVFRFPGGSNNGVSKPAQDPKLYGKDQWIMHDLVKESVKRGYTYYDWNVSVGDASPTGYTAESALQRVVDGAKGKKEIVVLAHDTAAKANTVKALPGIIQHLKQEGFTFKTMDSTVSGFAFLK
ncbi:exo-beta-N-acetylmuramidase NamZ domain-containing protein [Ammoniphilus sp. YIM 78166]|uniref:exo-beta-N-acetylmuramidase NamZ domain-containing protein n=1 Tax=Ammoniphilus sp. YIM 78166 TaxID=1644106 RepID=UPI00106F4FAB|nr:exo-beta-N-acetylmuramidase NamZ domain-containing protein [Ammoniphilus sp. YIM 78166]